MTRTVVLLKERYQAALLDAWQEVAGKGIDHERRLLGAPEDVLVEVRCSLRRHLMGRVYAAAQGYLFVAQAAYVENPRLRGGWYRPGFGPDLLLIVDWLPLDRAIDGAGWLVESQGAELLCPRGCRERVEHQLDRERLTSLADAAVSAGKRQTYLCGVR